MDYAIRFAEARRLPLVLNTELRRRATRSRARPASTRMIDSVLAAHPGLVFTISAGNDGPGLSTVGFPGSADRAISVGATVPGTFLAPDRSRRAAGGPAGLLQLPRRRAGQARDRHARAWPTPRCRAGTPGQEIAQGTSMASPHAAGLAALLVSAAVQEKRAVEARAIKQALMVTARPLAGRDLRGRGDRAARRRARRIAGSQGDRAGAGHRGARSGEQSVDAALSEVRPGRRAAGACSSSSCCARHRRPRRSTPCAAIRPGSSRRARVTLTGARDRRAGAVHLAALKPPGAYVGTVTGWGADSLAGPGVPAGQHDRRAGAGDRRSA